MNFLKNLFGKKETTQSQPTDAAVTAPLSELQINSISDLVQYHYEPVQFLVSSGQSVGRQRELNEDCIFTLASTIAGQRGSLPFGLLSSRMAWVSINLEKLPVTLPSELLPVM